MAITLQSGRIKSQPVFWEISGPLFLQMLKFIRFEKKLSFSIYKITTGVLGDFRAAVFANAEGELLLEANELVINALNTTRVSALDVSSSGYAKVYNNMISINGSANFDGITVANVGLGEFFHNTIRLQKLGTATGRPIAINFASTISAAAVWNNIFS